MSTSIDKISDFAMLLAWPLANSIDKLIRGTMIGKIDPQRLDSIFSIMVKIKWINSERYRAGTIGLLQECSTQQELDTAEHVLTSLKYCTSNDIEEAASDAATAISQGWKLTPQNTVLVGLAEPSRPCGSIAFVRAIQNKLPREWEASIYTTFVSAFRHRNGAENLVIVDDFVGTGSKVSERLDRLSRNPKTSNFRIHVVAFAGMNEGLTRIADLLDNRVNVHIALDKCIKGILPAERAIALANEMTLLEKKIFSNPGKYSFGYGQSEAAFYLESANIPNNSFPILWWDKYADESERSTLFSRR